MRAPYWTILPLLLLLSAGLTWGWWAGGHALIAEASTAILPDEMPKFFRAGAKALAHYSGDPDRWKNKACKHLKAAESPDHFIDLEDYQGEELPEDRWKAIALLHKLKQSPEKAGFLPYAILESFDRLTCAFYDHRKAPDDAAIQAKCLVYAGILSHMTGDCVMPLHTTRDYDGKRGPAGKMIQKGIHAKIDAFPEKHGLTAEEMSRGVKARKVEDVWAHVKERIKESHALIGKCYELDRAGAFTRPTRESRAFILERCRAGVQFTADLWYTAWLRSADLPPHW
jgi:hypothetical protein